ncbi:MAG: ferritin-like domain-containing protein [Acidobacteria bacterium]|nr:ferritin-like domain-containing protein [Acidobacteriota bacterium]
MPDTQRDRALNQIFKRVVNDPDLHCATLNLYYYSEFQGATAIADLSKRLEKDLPALSEHLVGHAADEFRHAEMIAGMMADMGATPTEPAGLRYVDEFEALTMGITDDSTPDEVEIIVGINVTEKRGLKSFALHVAAMGEDHKHYSVLNQIKNEEAGHVRWGNDYIKDFQKRGLGEKVKQAQVKFNKIETAAYETSLDIMPLAPIRRFGRILDIAQELPVEQRTGYVIEQFLRAADPIPLAKARWEFVSNVVSSPRMRDQISDDISRLVTGQQLKDDSILGRIGTDAWNAVRSMFPA